MKTLNNNSRIWTVFISQVRFLFSFSKKLSVMTCIGALVSLPLIRQALASDTNSFDTRESFLQASEQEFARRTVIRPMDKGEPLDRIILQVMEELNDICQMKCRVFWANGKGAYAQPQVGIGIDENELKKFKEELGEKSFREVIKFVLAHEQAHMKQYARYSPNDYMLKSNTRELELQADILAAGAMFWALHWERFKRPDLYNKTMPVALQTNLWLKFSDLIGKHPWDNPATHPNFPERALGISIGFNGGAHYYDVAQCKELKAQGNLTKLNEVVARIQEWKKENPNLPSFNPDTLETEDKMDWSRRIAKRYLQPGYDAVKDRKRTDEKQN